MPECYEQFVSTSLKLENHFKNMQDIEFTIENGKLYLLQTRNGKRTAQAALQIAVDMYNSGMITKEEALMQIEPGQLDSLLHPQFDKEDLKNAKKIGEGLPASPGAASGVVVFSVDFQQNCSDFYCWPWLPPSSFQRVPHSDGKRSIL